MKADIWTDREIQKNKYKLHNWRRSNSIPALALAVLSLDLTNPAYAQDTQTPQVDEIIVTADRRSKNLQQIPIAVTALQASDISEQQILTTRDLSRAVPNLVTTNNIGLGSSVIYFLRGVGNVESIPTFDLPVGTYVDEVFISRQNTNQIALSGVERVEVLRGPQGTLFGRNTTGGAISIVTQKPEDEFGGHIEVGAGSFDRFHGNAAVNVPLGDRVAARLSGIFVEDDGFLDNENNDETFNGESTFGLRAAVKAEVTDTITWNVSGQYVDTELTNLGTPEFLDNNLLGTREPVTGDLLVARIDDQDCTPSGDVSTFAGQGCTFSATDSTLLTSNLEFRFDAGTLNFITGYYESSLDFNIDFLGNTNQPVFGGAIGSNFYISNVSDNEQFSQEIKWSGEAFDGRLDYVAGLYYIDEENDTSFTDSINVPFVGISPTTIRDPLLNDTESIAAFIQGDYAVTDRLSLQLGVRYTDEDKTLSLSGVNFNTNTFQFDPLGDAELIAAGIPLEQSVSKFTPRAALFYDITDDISVYGSYTEGFKSGGWNVRGTSASTFQAFDEETVESFEIGLRTQLFDNRLRLNATAFNAVYDDFQLPTVFPGSIMFLTLNSGEAEVSGLEVDFFGAVTETFEIFGNFGLQDADYNELSAGAVAAGIGPDLQRTPEFTGRIGAAKTFEFDKGSLRLGGDVSYTSDYLIDPSNLPNSLVDDTAILNLQAALTFPSYNTQLIFECSNCTDEIYQIGNFFNVQYPSQPRRFGARIKYDF